MTTYIEANNYHRVFKNDPAGYWHKLIPTMKQVMDLRSAQNIIRNELGPALEKIYGVAPKFRVQGSWAYGTCNRPAQHDQEMDLDYGVYLPASVFTENKSTQEAKNYFSTVKAELVKLVGTHGWKIVPHDKCLRIGNVAENSHMDIPLYAVPDQMFNSFTENDDLVLEKSHRTQKSESAFGLDGLGIEALSNLYFCESTSIDLSTIEIIHMARMDGEWKPSDCEKVREWFQEECLQYPNKGLQLRAVVRYLKGWRDHTWATGGPSSILLMIIAAQSYKYIEGRDDLVLMGVTAQLGDKLEQDIYEEKIGGHSDENFNTADRATRLGNSQKAKSMHGKLLSAAQIHSPVQALSFLTANFGLRIPKDETLIERSFVTKEAILGAINSHSPARRETGAIAKPISGG